MKVKIDTKEKFHVITLIEPILSDNIAADLSQLVTQFLHQEISNVVLKIGDVENIEDRAAEELAQIQQVFYEKNASFVICDLKPEVEQKLDEMGLLEEMNITPSESEAWDIVQMEEIEREYMDDNNENL
ncbi:STAS domain-containing protein [Segetibacter sp.]|jgi:anti-anti-sigma regulatory factor|uniref:STAS domain-containing protein n=1 Tax=Segetibacter sp. TaxID=2231182 RepID=UPI00260E8FC1|nr:STAS domain-containing protein [Segetibacter sp.]